MNSFDPPDRPGRRCVAERLERLLTTVESLGQRLREALAQVLGQAIGDAIQDAISYALVGAAPAPARYADGYYALEYDPYAPEYGREEEYQHRWEEENRYAEPRPEPEDSAPEESLSRWQTAILAGLQAMALWLGERPGRRALLTALGVIRLPTSSTGYPPAPPAQKPAYRAAVPLGEQRSPHGSGLGESARRKLSRAVADATPALTAETTPINAFSTSSPILMARAFSMRPRVQT